MLTVTEYKIYARNAVPERLRFAFVSDLHGCDNAPVLEAIFSRSPDAILVGGDYTHNKENYLPGLRFLEEASAHLPTFVALGNHEKKTVEDIRELTVRTGATLLDNACVSFRGVKIGGLSSGYEICEKQDKFALPPKPDLEFLREFSREEGYKVLICHHPEYFEPYIKELPVDLTLSGHAHGGQWRFFGRGVFAPGQGIFPRYTAGLYSGNFPGGKLLVGRGLGNPHSVPRINNPPEVVIVDIFRCPDKCRRFRAGDKCPDDGK